MAAFTESATLSNGVKIPYLGLGTWRIADGQPASDAVRLALEIGYRHIDTAAVYGNEIGVGQAIRASRVPRAEIFLTTKVWNDAQRAGPAAVRKAFDESRARLGLDYIDLYLLHWAVGSYVENWKVLEELYAAGQVKAIGVSNFLPHHLETLVARCTVAPMVNQVEFHPRLVQPELIAACRRHHIVQEAWSPLMKGEVLTIPELQTLAGQYRKTVPQVVLRWEIQHGVVTIPKSTRAERLRQNAAIFDFQLAPQDMAAIDALDQHRRIGADPDNCPF
jgi:diketogulonate reductase-like aldo/keto reductase